MADSIKVTLDRRRAYRINETDRKAVWVGPGPVEVPTWVAEAWGLKYDPSKGSQESDPSDEREPSEDLEETRELTQRAKLARYDQMNASEIIEQADSWDSESRRLYAEHEKANKNRVTVLNALKVSEE